jgi:hypothetical protein
MNSKIEKLLNQQGANYILPFLWLHGEDEVTLRKYIGAIHASNIRAVCVESRPHPDYCGPQWWHDMDILLDEAKKREMKIWILDDSHFPTGYANGALQNAPDELCRQSIVCRVLDCAQKSKVKIKRQMLEHPRPSQKTVVEIAVALRGQKAQRKFDDDRLLGVYALRLDSQCPPEIRDLSQLTQNGAIEWEVPAGTWRVYILHLSRNFGPHRNYINMMDRESCRLLIDAVYEPHYAHYPQDFGKTIAGFFSDEPELGNGHLYAMGNLLGSDQDLPWSRALEEKLRNSLGQNFPRRLLLLWENEADASSIASVRYTYMDTVTRLVEDNFSKQIGQWCSQHGVEYIGHVIEDNNQHARTGTSLGHFFRGLSGQHMAGVDVVTRQILPQGEDRVTRGPLGPYDSDFYHFVLARLGSSHAAIDPLKNGRAMCEIFGNYGWAEGLRLEKYLADHFMVRGINHYVPHAFSPKKFPDPDCPPHFYAHGHHPQHRHFGYLMAYMNRVCALISDGQRVTSAAILYHGEAEWTGKCMLIQKPARLLAERQIDFDIIPQDVFVERERYKTRPGPTLRVNTQEYRVLIVPTAQFVTEEFARAALEIYRAGTPVVFIAQLPEGICNNPDPAITQPLLKELQACDVAPLEKLVDYLLGKAAVDVALAPSSRWIRHLHYQDAEGNQYYYLINEGSETYRGKLCLFGGGPGYAYNAWGNRLESIRVAPNAERDSLLNTTVEVEIEPLKSLILVFDRVGATPLTAAPVQCAGQRIALNDGWTRSICAGIAYPDFTSPQAVHLPDRLAAERPKFSGFVRYERQFRLNAPGRVILEISDAHEGVEVFANGRSAGIQIVPPFRFDLSDYAQEGENHLRIEVATTLERQVGRRGWLGLLLTPKPSALAGITGEVNLYLSDQEASS